MNKQAEFTQSMVALVNGRTEQLGALLGTADNLERFKTVALNAVVNDSNLLECDPASILEAIRDSATMGLEPSGLLGEAVFLGETGLQTSTTVS